MTGITSIGAYIPMYTLQREEIARMWGTKGIGGEKAVAGYDEDSITMAVAAVPWRSDRPAAMSRSGPTPGSMISLPQVSVAKPATRAAPTSTRIRLQRC